MKQRIVHGAEIDAVTKDEIADLLRDFASSDHVAFGGDSIERTQRDWPVKGHKRQIRVNASRGTDNFTVPAGANVYTDLLPEEHGRGGVSLVNIGANPCFVYLADAQTARDRAGAIAAGYMAAGGTWDGEISDWLWVGPVSVRSVLGTTLVVAIL